MWWNIWERWRGERSTLEQSIEESERKQRLVQWETEEKGGVKENPENSGEIQEKEKVEEKGADSIEKCWKELEKVQENIGMDDIWREENEPREEKYNTGVEERDRKKIRLEYGEVVGESKGRQKK